MNVLCTGKALIRNLKCLHQLRLHSSEIPFPTCFGIMLQAPKNIKTKRLHRLSTDLSTFLVLQSFLHYLFPRQGKNPSSTKVWCGCSAGVSSHRLHLWNWLFLSYTINFVFCTCSLWHKHSPAHVFILKAYNGGSSWEHTQHSLNAWFRLLKWFLLTTSVRYLKISLLKWGFPWV